MHNERYRRCTVVSRMETTNRRDQIDPTGRRDQIDTRTSSSRHDRSTCAQERMRCAPTPCHAVHHTHLRHARNTVPTVVPYYGQRSCKPVAVLSTRDCIDRTPSMPPTCQRDYTAPSCARGRSVAATLLRRHPSHTRRPTGDTSPESAHWRDPGLLPGL